MCRLLIPEKFFIGDFKSRLIKSVHFLLFFYVRFCQVFFVTFLVSLKYGL